MIIAGVSSVQGQVEVSRYWHDGFMNIGQLRLTPLKGQKMRCNNMHIGIIVKRNDELSLKLYDEDLRILEDESFSDVFSLNFFLQTLPRKYQISKTLLIVHNQRLNRVDMQIATNENSYYIT
jgi:hypothetical protein